MLDISRRSRRVLRSLLNLSFKQWLVIAVGIVAVYFLASWACAARRDARAEAQQTRRDEQHNRNVSADLQAADDNHSSADAREADRREADGRYQESERAVDRARSRAEQSRARDAEVTRRHEETRRTSTADMPDYSDDDACAKLKSVNLSAVGCREK